MTNDINRKNYNVELLRLFLTVAICLHHFRLYSSALPYGGGYIAVDCFFIISGYYLGRHIGDKRNREEHVQNYIWARWKRLYPDYIIAFGIAFLFRVITGVISKWNGGNLREALMIEFWCVNIEERINPPDWYCGYLIMASGIVYLFIRYFTNKKFVKYITGITVTLLYLVFMCSYSHINIYPQYQTVLSIAIVRALAGLLLGYFIYLLAGNSYDIIKKYSKIVGLFLIPFSVIGLAYILLWDNSIPYMDYLAILLFVILFYFVIEAPMEYKSTLIKKTMTFMGELCYVIYLNHYLVAFIFNKYSLFRGLDWKVTSLFFLISVFVFSMVMYILRRAIGVGIMGRLIKNGEIR